MPNEFSDELHSIEKTVKEFFLKELAKLEIGATTLLADLKLVLETTVDAAGPVVLAAASAGVQAALANTTGGLSAIVAAAEDAALGVLKSQGVTLADEALQQLKTLVLGNVLKSTMSTGDAAQASTGG